MAESIRTLAALAAAAGMSKGELEHAIRLGAVPASALTSTAGGHRKVRRFDAALEALNAYKGAGSAPQADYDLAQARAHREHFAALREELRYRQEASEVIDRAEAERAVVGQLRMLKDRLLELPARLEADLAALDDPHAVHLLLESALREAITDVRIRVVGTKFADGADADDG